jgi:type II secretory pathway pseudopilin PulG
LRKRKSSKASFVAGIIIIFAAALFIIGFFMYINSIQEESFFHFNRKNMGTKLLEEIESYDFTNNYPEDAAAVMDCYNRINMLIYGGYLVDDTLLGQLLTLQRQLWDESLLEKNPYDAQLEKLVADWNNLNRDRMTCQDITAQSPQRYPDDEEITTVTVTWQVQNVGEVVWVYMLREGDDGKFKVFRFEGEITPV